MQVKTAQHIAQETAHSSIEMSTRLLIATHAETNNTTDAHKALQKYSVTYVCLGNIMRSTMYHMFRYNVTGFGYQGTGLW